MTKAAGINRVPTGGSDNASARVQVANSLNAALAQGSDNATAITAAQASITTLTGALGGDLTGTLPNPTITANAVTNAKLAQMATKTIKGNNTGGTANALDLTAAQTKALLGGTLAQAPVVSQTQTTITDASGNMPSAGGSLPTSAEGSQLASATITPVSSSSTLHLEFDAPLGASVASFPILALFQDAGATALLAVVYNVGANNIVSGRIRVTITSGFSAGVATTFKVRGGLDRAGTLTVGSTTNKSPILLTITEILP